MKIKFLRPYLGSFLLHAFIIFLLFYVKPLSVKTEPESKTEILILENKPGSPQGSRGSTIGKKSHAKIPRAFLPKWDTNYLSGLTVASGQGGRTGILMPFGHGSGDLGKLAQFTIYDVLYKNIDELLVFPSVLAANKMEGVVNVQTFLKDSGEIDWEKFKITGGNEYFQIYILRVLKTVFARPLRQEYRKRIPTALPLDMSFSFVIGENGEKIVNDRKKFIMGHVLGFYKNSHQSMMQWKFGPLMGMLPLPSVNVNLGWIYDKIQGDDPLAKFMSENKL